MLQLVRISRFAAALLLALPVAAQAAAPWQDPVGAAVKAAPASTADVPEAGLTPAAETATDQAGQTPTDNFNTRFGIPAQDASFARSHAIHCDAVRHLKTPRTYRRLDSYMRPEAFMPASNAAGFFERDFATGTWGGGREALEKAGVDIYGCLGFDYLNVVESNLSTDPKVATTAPNPQTQRNYVQLYGLDFYSRLLNKKWKGGQLHFSFAWPDSRPISLYQNDLTPIHTASVHGNFYYDTGSLRDTVEDYQGFRVFEMWAQQSYGTGVHSGSFIRAGNIYPWINVNRSVLAGMFNFSTFDEPGTLGTNPNTGRGPIYPTAPLGVQWYHVINERVDFTTQVGAGYYDPSSGIDNRRGLRWFLTRENGVEGVAEVTYKGGTYRLDESQLGRPWYVKLGGQFHTGQLASNVLDVNGGHFQLTGQPSLLYHGNGGLYGTLESMVYREPGSYGQGLSVFAKTSQYFTDYRNVIKSTYVFGAGYEGLLPGRDRDVLYAGWGNIHMTKGAALWETHSQSCAQKAARDCRETGIEDILEFGYTAEVAPWLFAQSSFQYLIRPYGRADLGHFGDVTFSMGTAF